MQTWISRNDKGICIPDSANRAPRPGTAWEIYVREHRRPWRRPHTLQRSRNAAKREQDYERNRRKASAYATVRSVGQCRGTTISAATCGASDVQKALSSAAAGDTVSIPAGTCSWTTPVALWTAPANVIVRRCWKHVYNGGNDQTVIVDNLRVRSATYHWRQRERHVSHDWDYLQGRHGYAQRTRR